jgi:DNA-binding LacI/PurR family transcriptional regulator
MRVSIKDIAREAQVSHSTVSRALSDSPLVSAGTKARIQQLAREMGYSPDAQARSLVMGRTRTVGVVVTTITDPFIAEVVQSIENTAYDYGYSVILTSSGSQSKREIAAVEMLQSKRVDGVIVTSSRVGALYQGLLERLEVPIVLINSHRRQASPSTFSVNVDNRHGAYIATKYLIGLQHRRIGYVGGRTHHSDDQERQAGYCEALARADIEFDPQLMVPGNGRASGGERALPHLRVLADPPTAVLCYNDMTAVGLMRAARDMGIVVPDELSVVGFDDIPFASYVMPSLTTLAQPKAEMGRMAMRMVLSLIGDERAENIDKANVVVKGRLIVRDSSGVLTHSGAHERAVARNTLFQENLGGGR